MLVKEIIALAAQNLGRGDLKTALETGTEDGALQEEVHSLLRCYNFVENEIALEYFPLKAEESFVCEGGRLPYARFAHAPVNVHKAEGPAGNDFDFKMYPAYLLLPEGTGTVKVTYSYAPETKALDDECTFGEKISPRLMSFGIASEFLLSLARYSESEMWQRRYQEALRAAGILRRRLSVRARRWV